MGGALPVARILALRTVASHPLWAARRLGGWGGSTTAATPSTCRLTRTGPLGID